jgi:hypothetical protein
VYEIGRMGVEYESGAGFRLYKNFGAYYAKCHPMGDNTPKTRGI